MKSILTFIFLLFPLIVFSQAKGNLSGSVTHNKTGESLIGATVILEGTTLGSATDINGKFIIKNIPAATYNITASYIGCIAQTKFNQVIRSEGNIDLNFELQEEIGELD